MCGRFDNAPQDDEGRRVASHARIEMEFRNSNLVGDDVVRSHAAKQNAFCDVLFFLHFRS